MLQQEPLEQGIFKAAHDSGMGVICFSPLAQGQLTSKYLNGIPEGSRATVGQFLKKEQITAPLVEKISALNKMAEARGQTLAQMAIAWVLSHNEVTSALIGASRPEQIDDAVGALQNVKFAKAELAKIDKALNGSI